MILVHTCCADCALKFSVSVANYHQQKIDWYYYNPNIHPRSEYLARMKALKKIKPDGIDLIVPNYRPIKYYRAIAQLQDKFNQLQRCLLCWQLRLEASFEYAADHNYQIVSTTLVTSHYQDHKTINDIGQVLAKKYQLEFYIPDDIVCDLNTRGFYKQNYCGCAYSLVARMQEKYEENS